MREVSCDYADYHFNLGECETCPKCGYENHLYRNEPYCEWCGKPHRGWYTAVMGMIVKRSAKTFRGGGK